MAHAISHAQPLDQASLSEFLSLCDHVNHVRPTVNLPIIVDCFNA